MPDVLDENGLSLKSLTDIIGELETNFRAIYGNDINTEADTPDGQAIHISAQAAIDLRELLADIYASMDPDQASGTILDQRVAINGLIRNGATFTKTPIEITTDRALNLVGLDASSSSIDVPSGVYTVKDDAGNQFCLLASVTIASAGTQSLSFRAKNIGAVEVTLNTITTPVTIIAGVTAINNSSSITTQGVDEEPDASLKIRRRKSTANSGIGYLDSIEGALLSVDGVSEAAVTENVTATTDANGIPPHSIWAIVEGGANADIASVIFAKKSAGAGMKGSVSVNVPRSNNRLYEVKFDRPANVNLYIKFNISLVGGFIDTADLKRLIVENILWGLGQDALANTITAYVTSLNPNYRVTGMLLSLNNSTWDEIATIPTSGSRFINSTTRIFIT